MNDTVVSINRKEVIEDEVAYVRTCYLLVGSDFS